MDPRKVDDLIVLKLNKDNVREYMEHHDISVKKVIDLQHDDNRTATEFTDKADDISNDTNLDDDNTDIEDYLNNMWR